MADYYEPSEETDCERKRSETFGPLGPWRGEDGWTGEAYEAFQRLSFHTAPWEALHRPGMEQDGIVCIKTGSSRQVMQVTNPQSLGGASAPPIYIKRYRVNTMRRRLGNLLSGGKTRREFWLGRALLQRGIPTAVPLAYARARPGWNIGKSATYLATLGVDHDGTLLDWINEGRARQTANIYPALARFLAAMHERGFVHDDCSARNIVIARGSDFANKAEENALGLFVIMDLDHGKLGNGPAPLRGRALNLCQIMRHLRHTDLAASEAREEFLHIYLTAAERSDPQYKKRLVRQMNRFAQRKFGVPLITRVS